GPAQTRTAVIYFDDWYFDLYRHQLRKNSGRALKNFKIMPLRVDLQEDRIRTTEAACSAYHIKTLHFDFDDPGDPIGFGKLRRELRCRKIEGRKCILLHDIQAQGSFLGTQRTIEGIPHQVGL